MSTRRGVSLSELVVVMAMAVVIMTLSATTVFHLWQAEGAGVSALLGSTTVSRLATDFRRDSHAATKAHVVLGDSNNPSTIRLELAEGRVVLYRGESGRVVRQVTNDGGATSGTPAASETYNLPKSESHFEISDDPPLATLVHTRTLQKDNNASKLDGPTRTLRIDAAIAWDHRFEEIAE